MIAIAPQGVQIKTGTVGYFIAQDAEEVRRVTVFCKVHYTFFRHPEQKASVFSVLP